MNARRRFIAIAAGLVALSAAAVPFVLPKSLHYLSGDTTQFVALFPEPPARDSPESRRELDQLLELQRVRTPVQVSAARADARKDVSRFYAALGFDAADPPALPKLRAFTADVEDDAGRYVRAAKERFRRLRPGEVEPRVKPCVGGVRGDLSYPSGHATYGWVMVYLLAGMVPERQTALLARGEDFARQRMVCGVHFSSDLDAGRNGAAWLLDELNRTPAFRSDLPEARAELRAALVAAGKLPAR